MKKTSITVSLLCSVMFTQVQAENNFMECHRNTATFKQFCKIKDQANIVTVEISKKIVFEDSLLDISSTLRDGTIITAGTNPESLVLNSLRPQLQINSEWSKSSECFVSKLWTDEVYISINDRERSSGMQPSRLYPGTDSQTIKLALFSTDRFTPWTQTYTDENIRLEVSVSVFNKSHFAQRPLAFERIPLDCNLKLTDASFYFDMNIINQDLASLEAKAEVIIQDLIQIKNLESETYISGKSNLKKIMLGAFAVTAVAKIQNPDYQNPEWMSLDSISSLY